MDTGKKTTYHHAKNVRSTVDTRLFLESTLNLMRQIFIESHIGNHDLQPCIGRKCTSWDVLHPSFKVCAPANYPTNYDQWPGAPLPPNGRELNLPIQGTKRMLCAIRLNVKWLQSALIFGHHNVKTRPPGGRANKRFWTKANLSAYLRSCSCTGRLIDSIYLLAKNGVSDPPFPAAWSDTLLFSKCHYAPMHMLFLGHVKSDTDMVSKWLGCYETLATFGKQAKHGLTCCAKLES